ncbi:MAG: nucleotide pyrophosphatase [Candidatus Lokiarchaeota archaeon]|nr:nucleotide pyrophosphatase [Candidatus Lokiarchaeota archaeon]
MTRKVLVIGLDCAPPDLLFNKFIDDLPNLKYLINNGISAPMRSSDPPITIPAWMVMSSGVDPGFLGLYGFRHRKDNSYKDIWLANTQKVQMQKVWDIIGDFDIKSCLVGIPPTYPIKWVNGWTISGFLTPNNKKQYTYPRDLKLEIKSLVDDYIFDVEFRTDKKDRLIKDLYKMTKKRHKVIKYLLKEKPWDFFMFVEIGLDRVQHAFWKFFDENHLRYEPNKYSDVIFGYYKLLDKQMGEILKIIDKNTIVIVVSDHGGKPMTGCFCINEWLIKEGYLVLNEYPDQMTSLDDCDVNWAKTKAWGWGGYYARVFFNIKGREQYGTIDPSDLEIEKQKLKEKILKIKDPTGKTMKNEVYEPKDLYKITKGDPPDLMVYFDDLFWRSAGTIGHNKLYLEENDKGPDDMVHDYYGVFILYDPKNKKSKKIDNVSILDVAPTILDLFEIDIPGYMRGKIIK